MNMYAEGVFTADAFAVGVLVSACYRRNRCENDVEMLYNNTWHRTKHFWNQRKMNEKTAPNRCQKVLGTMPAPKRAFEGGGRKPPEPRWTILGSIIGLEILENREKHHLGKTWKNMFPPKWKNMPKRYQNGVEMIPKRMEIRYKNRWREILWKS